MLIELTAIICSITGVIVVWANPRRVANQVFGLLTLFLLLFLWFVYNGVTTPRPDFPSFAFPWHRANAACATLFPWLLWLLHQALLRPETSRLELLRRSVPWLGFAVVWSLLCLTDSFIYRDPGSQLQRARGIPYLIYSAIGLGAYSLFIAKILRITRDLTGVRRFELRFLALNIGFMLLAGVAVTSIGNFFYLQASRRLLFVIIIVGYCISGWAIAAYRIFDPRRSALSLSFTAVTALLLGLAGLGIWDLYRESDQHPLDLFVGLALVGGSILWLDRKAREWFGVGNRTALAEFRRLVIDLARTEPAAERLIIHFEALLRARCKNRFVALLPNRSQGYVSGHLTLAVDHPGLPLMREHGWVTPESLQRRHSGSAGEQLCTLLERHSLGLMLSIPVGSRTPTLIVALGMKANGWPFTYPEIERLQNVAELMDNILTRSRLTEQAALQARMEHLAMMSRGLAHDLKNLITPVSSFLIHTEGRYTPNSAEAEVHFAAQRSIRIMTDYVREALFFSERLAPKFELSELAPILTAVRETTVTRARNRSVTIEARSECAVAIVADAVLIQRMLANLVANAIDASPSGGNVLLLAVRAPSREQFIRFKVVDQGSGIAPEHINRVFDAYFTTKEFGDQIRGFGLGLTIAKKIADLHDASISLRSRLGVGTTVTIDMPMAQAAISTAALFDGASNAYSSPRSRRS